METDRISGKFKDVTGQAEAAVGDAVGDTDTQVSGRTREAAGVAQNLYGKAQDAIGDMLGDTAGSADKAFSSAQEALASGTDTLIKEVNARPLISLLIAAIVGYLLAHLFHSTTSSRR